MTPEAPLVAHAPPSGRPPGINLSDRRTYDLVRQIFLSKFVRKVRLAGLDPDDVLQSVYLGLITRNEGRSRWDPSRGALSTWIFVATNGIVLNAIESHRARLRGGDVGDEADASSWETVAAERVDLDAAIDDEDVRARLAGGADPWLVAIESGVHVAEAALVVDLVPPHARTPARPRPRKRRKAARPLSRRAAREVAALGLPEPLRAKVVRGTDPFMLGLKAGMDFVAAATLAMDVRRAVHPRR